MVPAIEMIDKRNKAEIVDLSFLSGWGEGDPEQLAGCIRLFKILPVLLTAPSLWKDDTFPFFNVKLGQLTYFC